ncbi:MAG: sulfate ABC transporter substrate-binding protein [Brachymonas sp.]|nr:sulfate ABC transporter substrate-binding protein [Brachymonas sp.]
MSHFSLTPHSLVKLLAGSALLAGMLAGCKGQSTGTAASGAAPAALAASSGASGAPGAATLLNVSYDVAREFYKDINAAYLAAAQKTDPAPDIQQSHGGSSKQVRSVAEGLQADVVTMNQASDIDFLADKGLVSKDWKQKFPDNAVPNTSLSVILVRKGNPKQIHDWADLAKPDVQAIIPNPKVTGNGRYTWVAIWGAALKDGKGEAGAADLAGRIFANVPVLDGGGRAATTTFAQRKLGDALVTFESEVPLIQREFGEDFEVVYPKWTVLAENPVAVVETVVDKKGTRKAATDYLQWLWSPEAQEIAAQHHLRPRNAEVLARHAKDFPQQQTFTVDELLGGWGKVLQQHFGDGGFYDKAMAQHRKK